MKRLLRFSVEKLLLMQTEQAAALEVQMSASDSQDPSSSAKISTEDEMNQTVVSLNDVKDGVPVFFIHGAGGGVLVLRKIAKQIHVPVYGIQDTAETPLAGTLLSLANFYLKQLKKKQPTGPYRLGGFSFGTFTLVFILLGSNNHHVSGTVVALNMAQILHESGDTVELLIMLDGAPTLFHRPMMRESARKKILDGTLSDNVSTVKL